MQKKTKDANTQSSELFQAVIHPTKEWQESKINFSIEEGDTLTAGLTISAPPVYVVLLFQVQSCWLQALLPEIHTRL